jgi:AcrR family transcriptional regulator
VSPDREALIERVRPFVEERGIGALDFGTLAPVAGVSADDLRAAFGTKEKLVAELIARDRMRGRAAIERIDADAADWEERLASIWRHYLYEEKVVRLFFESLGLALTGDDRRFVHGIDGWLQVLEPMLTRDGVEAERARAFATLIVAVQRGAMMDVFATGERVRVNEAMAMWSQAAGRELPKR